VAPHARHEDPLALGGEPAAVAEPRHRASLAWPLVALWAAMIAGFIAFLVFGSVRIGAGYWIGRRMPIREIWTRFLAYLGDQGASPAIVAAVAATVAVTAVGVGWALWLALGLTDAPAEPPPDDTT
jgi:hypothetical protein